MIEVTKISQPKSVKIDPFRNLGGWTKRKLPKISFMEKLRTSEFLKSLLNIFKLNLI